MAKMKSKGTVLAITISSVYTAIPQIISINKTGEGSADKTFDGTTLDGGPCEELDPSGYYKPCVIGAEFFYDAANATHAFLKTTMRAPANLPVNSKLTYTDAGPVSEVWPVVGISIDEKFQTNDGVKSDLKLAMGGANS